MKSLILRTAGFLSRVLPEGARRRVYRLGPVSRLVRRALNRAAPSGLSRVTVAGGALAGMAMVLDLQTEKDYWLGTYEIDLQAAVSGLVRPGWVAYDVGANVGYVSLMLARSVGEVGRVFAFEALPQNVERLRRHVALNGLDSRVAVVPRAVAATSGPVRFLLGPSGAMGKAEGSAGRMGGHRESLEVPGISLDDFVYVEGNPPPQVIKMDIEGGEVLALRGMRRLLAAQKPLILLELHGHEAAEVAWETLTGAGYTLCQMRRGFPGVSTLAELDWKAYLVARP